MDVMMNMKINKSVSTYTPETHSTLKKIGLYSSKPKLYYRHNQHAIGKEGTKEFIPIRGLWGSLIECRYTSFCCTSFYFVSHML